MSKVWLIVFEKLQLDDKCNIFLFIFGVKVERNPCVEGTVSLAQDSFITDYMTTYYYMLNQ